MQSLTEYKAAATKKIQKKPVARSPRVSLSLNNDRSTMSQAHRKHGICGFAGFAAASGPTASNEADELLPVFPLCIWYSGVKSTEDGAPGGPACQKPLCFGCTGQIPGQYWVDEEGHVHVMYQGKVALHACCCSYKRDVNSRTPNEKVVTYEKLSGFFAAAANTPCHASSASDPRLSQTENRIPSLRTTAS